MHYASRPIPSGGRIPFIELLHGGSHHYDHRSRSAHRQRAADIRQRHPQGAPGCRAGSDSGILRALRGAEPGVDQPGGRRVHRLHRGSTRVGEQAGLAGRTKSLRVDRMPVSHRVHDDRCRVTPRAPERPRQQSRSGNFQRRRTSIDRVIRTAVDGCANFLPKARTDPVRLQYVWGGSNRLPTMVTISSQLDGLENR